MEKQLAGEGLGVLGIPIVADISKDKTLAEMAIYILIHKKYLTCQAFVSQEVLGFLLTFTSFKKEF